MYETTHPKVCDEELPNLPIDIQHDLLRYVRTIFPSDSSGNSAGSSSSQAAMRCFCAHSFTSEDELLSHILQLHHRFKCRSCNLLCASEAEIDAHQHIALHEGITEHYVAAKYHQQKLPVSGGLLCPSCPHVSATLKLLEDHQSIYPPGSCGDTSRYPANTHRVDFVVKRQECLVDENGNQKLNDILVRGMLTSVQAANDFAELDCFVPVGDNGLGVCEAVPGEALSIWRHPFSRLFTCRRDLPKGHVVVWGECVFSNAVDDEAGSGDTNQEVDRPTARLDLAFDDSSTKVVDGTHAGSEAGGPLTKANSPASGYDLSTGSLETASKKTAQKKKAIKKTAQKQKTTKKAVEKKKAIKKTTEEKTTEKKTTDKKIFQCKDCDVSFKRAGRLLQHLASRKHHPLCEISCSLSTCCGKAFTSPSAFISHVESGDCSSSVDKYRLDACVKAADKSNCITEKTNSQSACLSSDLGGRVKVPIGFASGSSNLQAEEDDSSSGLSSHKRISDCDSLQHSLCGFPSDISDMEAGDDDDGSSNGSHNGFVIVGGSDAADEWSTLSDDQDSDAHSNLPTPETGEATEPSSEGYEGLETTIVEQEALDLRLKVKADSCARSCAHCGRVFTRVGDRMQHESSPVHDLKKYHCPENLVGLETLFDKGTKPKTFKTLSALLRHLEDGTCLVRDKDVLRKVMPLIERALEGIGMKEGTKLLHSKEE